MVASARGVAPTKFSGLYRLKANTAVADLFSLFPQAIVNERELAVLHGEPFPASIAALLSVARLGATAPMLNEVVWAISSALVHATRLSRFCALRAEFEKALLKNNLATCADLLETVEQEFGWSLWLVQNRLTIVQIADGIDEKRRIARVYEEGVHGNNILTLLLSFISQRCEGTTVPGYLQGELSRLFPDANAPSLEAYLRTTLFDLANPTVSSIAPTLSYASQSSVIDYFETLMAVLQALAADPTFPDHLAMQLSKPLYVFHRRVADRRLVPVLVALSDRPAGHVSTPIDRAALIEAYSEGRYEDVVNRGSAYLAEYPDDISAVMIFLRSELKANSEPIRFSGVLGELADNLRQIFSLSSETYTAAYSLFTLYERFYGHSWATYVRAVVMHELSQETAVFPSAGLRRQYAVDVHLTPFSCLLARSVAKKNEIQRALLDVFSSTAQVFSLVAQGEGETPHSISEERRRRYMGRYYLAHGEHASAIENFRWIQENTSGAEALRASACAALAFVQAGDFRSAVETVADAYDSWPHVPTVLPIPEIISRLEQPSTWPNSIALPLTFELYSSFFSDDRLSHLRYAFERFQLENNIGSPGDVLKLVDTVGEAQLVHYLYRVWRPEVMSQTLLYESTKEIEDARIKVCKLLTELDPSNAARYVSEIRERVKQQEIAKATSLVAQSKVYVDIGAIKKALKAKLGDAYARYKSAVSTMPVTEDPFVETITDIISQVGGRDESLTKVLSDLHMLSSEVTNELDVQFASMFSEVTNEFLRGDHGLNAYLSTRVRHGKLSNALRKSVADEHLVTARKEGDGSYVENRYWATELTDADQATRVAVLESLQSFATDFDEVLTYVRDKLIQIAIIHEFVDSGSHPHALFVYRSSNLERRFVQAYDRKAKYIDEFIDRCIETLWEKTDENLIRVQQVLNTSIRAKLLSVFDRLSEALKNVPSAYLLGDLINHVARARTNTQNALTLVASWFKRSEVYDRQDYFPDFAVLVATNMVVSTVSGAGEWDGVKVHCESGSSSMPGRTLDGMVDIFDALIENAIEHASVPIDEVSVDVSLKLSDGEFSATIENATGAMLLDSEAELKLEKLREEIKKSDSRRKAQLEGRSGFHKIWATINAPQYREPSLDFRFTSNGTFKVNLGFKIGAMEDEDSVD